MHYGKSVLGHNIVLCKEPYENKCILIDNLPYFSSFAWKLKLLVFISTGTYSELLCQNVGRGMFFQWAYVEEL